MERDDEQRTRHNARIMAENAAILAQEFTNAGLRESTIDGMMAAYFKAVLDGAQMQVATDLLSSLATKKPE